jgi:hypothetical protein
METITDSRVLGQEHSMNQKFTLPQKALPIHVVAEADKHTRYANDHVQFDSPADGKIRASATNNRLIVTAEWHDSEAECLRGKALLVPASLLEITYSRASASAATIETNEESVTVSGESGEITTGVTGPIGTLKFAPIDNVIPNYSASPDAPKGTVIRLRLSHSLLGKLLDCFTEINYGEDGIDFVFPATQGSPITATTSIDSVRITGALAAMRLEGGDE